MENQAAIEASNQVNSSAEQLTVHVTKVKRKVYANHPLSLHQGNEPFGKCDYFAALGPDSAVLGFAVTWRRNQDWCYFLRRIVYDNTLTKEMGRVVRRALIKALHQEYPEGWEYSS